MRPFIGPLALALLAFALCAPAQAHPLGNFTINHLAKVRVDSRGMVMRYIVDMAEIPTFQVMRERGIDGAQRAERLSAWAHDEVALIDGSVEVRADGALLDLRPAAPRVSTRPGAGGLPTLYFVDEFRAPFPKPHRQHLVTIADRMYPGRIGWKDIVVEPESEPTRELRSYPNALLGSPRAVTGVSLSVSAGGSVLAKEAVENQSLAQNASAPQTRSNLLSDMLAKGSANPFIVLFTFLIAIGLGALHALEPGHGKTLLAVSLVGARATPKQALILAGGLTLAHTAGVLALGVVLLALAQWIVPENVYPWITLMSGMLVAMLGAAALARSIKARRGRAQGHDGRGQGHDHASHGHDHSSHEHGHGHDHPTVAGSAPLSFRSVALIAMSGNIAPCPAALVVLLTALSLHQVGYGLLVVVAFSIGLASVLTGLGIAVVRGASWLSNRRAFNRIAEYGPLLTAGIICAIGAVMIGKASAGVLQAPALIITLLVLAAIGGYALSPGHTHSGGDQLPAHQTSQKPAALLEKEAT